MGLAEELAQAAERAATFARPGETLSGIVAAEPEAGRRLFLCAFEQVGQGEQGAESDGERRHAWLAIDGAGEPVVDEELLREAVTISAMCELAEETAGGGQPEELRQRIEEALGRDAPAGLAAAQVAIDALIGVIQEPPRLATPAYLDDLGAATRELERALGQASGSPFAAALQQGMGAVDELVEDVARNYKLPLSGKGS